MAVCLASSNEPLADDPASVRRECEAFANVATEGGYEDRLRVLLPVIDNDLITGHKEEHNPQ